MANQLTERQARMVIAIGCEPGDERVGAAVAEFGAIRAIENWKSGLGPKGVREAIVSVLDSPLLAQATKSLNSVRGRFLIPSDAEWPLALSDLDVAAPIGLWCVGDRELSEVSNQAIAVVGARNATTYGERVASDIGGLAAEMRVTVISGAAFGIDAASHRGALAASGETVAVLACGVDVAYPQAHRGLLTRISEQGLVVSEAPPGARPHKHRFLSRNRLIAALGSSTVVVEAALRSGSLSTANWASALGRPVWGIPGPLTSAASAGVHAAIRDGVMKLVANPIEIFSQFAAKPAHQLGLLEGTILGLISRDALPTSEISMRLGGNVDSHSLFGALTVLQMQGVISQGSKGWQLVSAT
ncbi:MAG: DNA-processing protein DprA [Actinomycetes bacterium]